ncbi:hypothetical protein [Enterobacter ludwigii]|uniref:hypothetical protein n=1 Tax=Enterobacter TaxID=547 RepID=UPI003BEF2458
MNIIPFDPTSDTPLTFSATVGGTAVYGTVLFNIYAQRFYLRLTGGSNQTLVYVPMVDSPDDFDINLALPLAPGKLVYRASTSNIEAS